MNAEGAPHGRGSYEIDHGYDDVDKYIGTFVKGKRDGFGQESRSDGLGSYDCYAGELKEGEWNGFGKVFVYSCLHSQWSR